MAVVSLSLDAATVAWLDQMQKNGHNKSELGRQAFRLYIRLGDVLDVQNLADNLTDFPEMVERLSKIEKSLEILERIESKLDNAPLVQTETGEAKPINKKNILGLLDQMEDM